MKMVDCYEEHVYTNEYYLTQYVLSRVFLRKKYCYLLLTAKECKFLKEHIPDMTINKLYELPESEYIAYEFYKN